MLFPVEYQVGPPGIFAGLVEVDLAISPCLVMDRGIAFFNAAVLDGGNMMTTGL